MVNVDWNTERKIIDETANNRKMQAVILTFDDGTKAFFTGKAVCYPPETRKVRDVKFTEPRDLLDGYYFEE